MSCAKTTNKQHSHVVQKMTITFSQKLCIVIYIQAIQKQSRSRAKY